MRALGSERLVSTLAYGLAVSATNYYVYHNWLDIVTSGESRRMLSEVTKY